MPEIGIYDARTNFSKLLERAEKGERFVIIRYGRPVAEVVPIFRHDPEAVRRAIGGIRTFRESLRKRGVHLRTLPRKKETIRDLAHRRHRY